MAVLAVSSEWARIAATTLPRFVKGAEDATFRNRVLLRKLKQKGRVKTNVSGDGLSWRVRFMYAPMTTNNGAQPITFSGKNRYVKAFLDYEGYQVNDFVTKRERLKNKGTEAILNIYGTQVSELMEDIQNQFPQEIYINSAAAGNEGRMSGIETMLGTNGQSINVTSGALRARNIADPTIAPSATYAGLSTALGNLGGSWNASTDINSTWPYGLGTPEYDATSPTIVDYTSSAFSATATWAANAQAALRHGIWAMKRNADVTIPLVMTGTGMYRDFLNSLAPKERINLQDAEGDDKLGYGNSIYWDGAQITSEFGIPGGVAYGFDLNSMDVISLQDDLFVPDGPTENQVARGWVTVVDCLGNFKFRSPRNFCKWMNGANA